MRFYPSRSVHVALALFSAFSLAPVFSPLYAAVKPTEAADAPALPEIWQKVSAQDRLKALRAAEVDATRLLLERIMGLQISSDTSVRDMALAHDTIRGGLTASIKGVVTTEAPEYLPDGRVQVVRAVKVQQVIEVLSRVVKQEKLDDGTVKTLADASKSEIVHRNEKLDVVGSSALPGSEGLLKIKAKRAAEADAYRKLGERILGVKVTSDSTVRDLALKNDEVVKSMAGIIKGAEATAIQFQKDGSCDVTMQVKLGEVIRTVTRVTKGKSHMEDSIESKTIAETGSGTAANDTAASTNSGTGGEEEEISTTLRRVISEKPANN